MSGPLTNAIPASQAVEKNGTGTYTFDDDYTLNIPWSSDAALPGQAQVTYGATQ